MGKEKKPVPGRLTERMTVELRSPEIEGREQVSAVISKFSDDIAHLEISKPLPSVPFKAGEKIRLTYWDEEAIYVHDAEVQEVSGKKGDSIVVSIPGEPVSIQRRSAPRVRVSLPFSFKVLDASYNRIISDQLHKSKTMDISLTGLRFDTNLPFKEGDQLEVAIQVARGEAVSLRSTVSSISRSDGKGRSPFVVGVEFFDLSAEERRKLSEFLSAAPKKS